MLRWLRIFLCLALATASVRARAVERIVEVRGGAPIVPVLKVGLPVDVKLSAAQIAVIPGAGLMPQVAPVAPEAGLVQAAAPQVAPAPLEANLISGTGERGSADPAATPADASAQADPAAGWVDSSQRFDKAAKTPPAAIVLGAALPAVALGAAPLVHGFHALAPYVNAASYDAANVLSVAFPMPEAYGAFRRGTAKGFPLGRAALGAAGTLALGLVNATVLGKTLWGVMHAFIALGMLAPYVIGKAREKKGPIAAYQTPAGLAQASRLRKLADRVLHDPALRATAAVGLLMLAASAGLYAAASAFVPAMLAAHMSAHAIDNLLLGIQIAKGALFIGVFAPDVMALVKGKPAHGFSKSFTSIYLASVAAFTAWGFLEAAASPAGAIRDQYLIHGARNLAEAVASALSLLAIHRAATKNPAAAASK